MQKSVLAERYMIDVSEPTKADVDKYFSIEKELMKNNALMDRLKPNDKRAAGILAKVKNLYMDFSKNKPKIAQMAKSGMIGPMNTDFARVERRINGMYQYISRCCVAAKNGKDPADVF